MYHHSFGLQMPPFEDRIDPALFFPTPEIEEALAALEYECFHGKGALSIIGEAGTGKTLLVRRFLASVRSEDQVVVWTCPCGTETSLLREVCKCFKIGVPASQDPARMLDRLRRHLKKKDAPADARRPAMILDQVENLSPRALTELVDLANLADEADAWSR
jgi:type II secretory pathway predicted ATPase ExeA